MNSFIPDETYFQKHIVECLTKHKMYNECLSDDFDLDAMCHRGELLRFLKLQEKEWGKLCRKCGGEEAALQAVIDYYNSRLNQGENLIHILNGVEDKVFKVRGVTFKLVQYRPQLLGYDDEPSKLYHQNRFSVIREFHYSTDAKDKGNRIDLVFLINGIPFMTCELKNELSSTHWNYTNAIHQYMCDRNPRNRFLRTCLVHFAVDNNFAFMTTQLKGGATKFLPFNTDVINPPIEGEYATAYLWNDIWQPDSLLNLLQHFIKNYDEVDKEGNKTNVTIFPRFHQMRAVRHLVDWSREQGAGHNFLIEHSAGSGKTKSMAWLAHQLVNTIGSDGNPVFDSIIMVTDRIVLNANMADDVNYFSTVNKLVKDIRTGSKNLATAINEGGRIIVCTVQKFSFALPSLRRDKARRYAVIIDEAHTAMGAESAKDVINALSTEDEIHTILQEKEAEFENSVDALLAYMQSVRQSMPHLSFYAFTATPKDKTYQLFGRKKAIGKGYEAHDLYSMHQAISEHFILDVLQNYTTYQTLFTYIEKVGTQEEEQSIPIRDENGVLVGYKNPTEYEKNKSIALIMKQIGKEPETMKQKAEFALAHFMEKSIRKINGKAKAMFVCESREAVVRYTKIFRSLIAQKYNNQIKVLAAFSDTIEVDGIKYNEESLNGAGIKDNGIKVEFQGDEYRILIAADKFQTGFDQPLLHTMYVDKHLGGVQAIQTLSRLNRQCEGKDDTCVIDFRNSASDIRDAFEPYYKGGSLSGEFDPEKLNTYRSDVRAYGIYSQEEVDNVVNILLSDAKSEAAASLLKRIVDECVFPMKDEEKTMLRKYVKRYIRSYGFLSQVMDYIDTDLEKEYVFLKALYGYLPYSRETLPMDILDKIDLEKLKINYLTYDGAISLVSGEPLSPRYTRVKKPVEDDKATLAEILDIVNESSIEFLNNNDSIFRPIVEKIETDSQVLDAFQADNNYNDLYNLVVEKIQSQGNSSSNAILQLIQFVTRGHQTGREFVEGLIGKLSAITQNDAAVVLDLEVLKSKIVADMTDEFAEISGRIRPLEEVVDFLLKVIQHATTAKYDGANDIILDSLNILYTMDNIRNIDRRRHFNSLVTKYEVFLKKLYYICNHCDIQPGEDRRFVSLVDAIKAFDSLNGLWRNGDARYHKFSEYLEMVKEWRNAESHTAPVVTESEIVKDIHILTAMYVYVISQETTELDMAGLAE